MHVHQELAICVSLGPGAVIIVGIVFFAGHSKVDQEYFVREPGSTVCTAFAHEILLPNQDIAVAGG
jgi:hypothetical protein